MQIALKGLLWCAAARSSGRVASGEWPARHAALFKVVAARLRGESEPLQAAPAAEQAAGKSWWKLGAATLAAGTVGLAAASSIALADEAEHGLHPPSYPWPHEGFFRCWRRCSVVLQWHRCLQPPCRHGVVAGCTTTAWQ